MEGEFAVELPFFRSHLSNETKFTSRFRQYRATSARYCFHVVWNLLNFGRTPRYNANQQLALGTL